MTTSKTKYTLEIEDDNLYDLSEIHEVLDIKEVCGWYNKDTQGNYCKDEKHVKYLHLPPDLDNVNFDLNRQHEDDLRKPEAEMKESIDSILKWVSRNSKDEDGKPKRPETDFVCYRGLLSRIMCIPYENKDGLKICAIKSKGTTYLCKFITEQNKADKLAQAANKDLARFTRWGHVFEHYMVTHTPGTAPDPSQPMSEHEELNCVYRSQIGSHNLIYGAEIDGLKKREDLDNLFQAQLVELKTCRQNSNNYSFSRYKLIKWWTQSVLAKIDTIVVGYRDDEGFVKSLKEIKVQDLPKRAKGWSAPKCMVFLKDFLSFVTFVMKDATEDDVYEFVWHPNDRNYTGTKLPEGNACNFFPDWFQEWLQQLD